MELLVVIGIIAVLAALLTPALMAAMDKAHETRTLSRIHQGELAAQAFFNDHGDYPPSHWAELDDIFEYDPDANGDYDTFDGLNDSSNPNTINEGIEVFLACVASQQGAYMEPPDDMLRDVDGQDAGDPEGDFDADVDGDYDPYDVYAATNWLFGGDGSPVFELVDWWGNPLVYFHNRDYADHDGWDQSAGEYYEPTDPDEQVEYADEQGALYPCYARSTYWRYDDDTSTGVPNVTGNHPNLNTFQLYSWGLDLQPGCAEAEDPGTGAPEGYPNPNQPGIWAGWTSKSGNLCNWEERAP
ncbi:MAG: hypothetical protein AMK73_01120 [Planctomycetes bacterium SM23_32]|nr:MAG: hypothetical protein AMK73_01120 [Planctomycetes bacterium SM23_32]